MQVFHLWRAPLPGWRRCTGTRVAARPRTFFAPPGGTQELGAAAAVVAAASAAAALLLLLLRLPLFLFHDTTFWACQKTGDTFCTSRTGGVTMPSEGLDQTLHVLDSPTSFPRKPSSERRLPPMVPRLHRPLLSTRPRDRPFRCTGRRCKRQARLLAASVRGWIARRHSGALPRLLAARHTRRPSPLLRQRPQAQRAAVTTQSRARCPARGPKNFGHRESNVVAAWVRCHLTALGSTPIGAVDW
mmetsp:Transcript_28271/g.78069  ORF Transcript_28271/g.78069 Transcript_28271/m.78069 type:complete len:244 (+) Transcript_28271:328-1059(+)